MRREQDARASVDDGRAPTPRAPGLPAHVYELAARLGSRRAVIAWLRTLPPLDGDGDAEGQGS